jgi:hypothetical protein
LESWIDVLLKHRRAQQSNVFLIQTADPERFNEALSIKLPKKGEQQVVIYRPHVLLLSRFEDEGEKPIEVDLVGGIFNQLNTMLSENTTLLLIETILTSSGAETVRPWLQYWSHNNKLFAKQSTVLVFTASTSFFPEALRRLCVEIEPPISTSPERERVVRSVREEIVKGASAKGIDTPLADDEHFNTILPSIIQLSSGLTLHEISVASRLSFFEHRDFKPEVYSAMRTRILSSYGLSLEEPKRGFESVGGYSYIKTWLIQRIKNPILNPVQYQKYGIPAPKGLILYGYPGCGKTWIAKALAKELSLPFVYLRPSDFLRGIVGETEARAKQIISLIEALAPVVVFIDECDQLLMNRSQMVSTDSGVSARLTSSLLEWLGSEDRQAFIVGATNFVERVDPAFLRPGRVDKTALVLTPDRDARKEILHIHLNVIKKRPVENLNLDEIADKTVMWTGAELEQLVNEASWLAVEQGSPITTEIMLKAMKTIKPELSERKKRLQEYIKIYNSLENADPYFQQQISQTEDAVIASLFDNL